ncbi:MAG: 3-phosphoshikimate 1-carboxyvinyltransferase [Actinomycetota bacterium]|nr:3-phosphoshikimate 1-carboxyvinyltransferase [Actinomycetota bacterium]
MGGPAGVRAVVRAGGPLRGATRVPGDKSISHRALIVSGLAAGRSEIDGLSTGDDVRRTAEALRACGVGMEAPEGSAGRVVVTGRALELLEPERPLDVGNSGTAIRLLSGVAASQDALTVLVGDESVHRRPMERVVGPLREMGARIDGREGGRFAPIVVRGGGLHGIDYSPPVASAQVKAAVLLAGLRAEGETTVRERVATRRHTEEVLALAGRAPWVEHGPGGYAVRITPGPLEPFEMRVPGDPSQAAFLVVAAVLVPGSEVVVENVYVGPGRAGFLSVLERMGADVTVVPTGPTTADVVARHGPLVGTEVRGAEVPDCIDEIPVLAVAAAFAEGTTVFADAAELRVKESDRIATTSAELARMGVSVEPALDGLVVHGGRPRPASRASAYGDHRVAMALAVATLAAGGGATSEIEGFGSVSTSWPGFLDTIEALR